MTPLSKKILLRVSESEHAKITLNARQQNLSVNNYLRAVGLGLPLEETAEMEARVATLEAQVASLLGRKNGTV